MTSSRLTLKLALLALVCYAVYDRWVPTDETVIELSPAIIDRIVERQEAFLGRALTPEERALAKERYVDEEILVREAFRRGLDRVDRSIRPMLVEHASRELMRAAGYEPPVPTEDELRSYFEAHAEHYRIPARIDIQLVRFAASVAPTEPLDVLDELRSGADFRSLGSAGALGASVEEVALSDLARAFGLEPAREIFSLPPGEWHGPFVSAAGTHLFRVVQRRPGRERSYQEVRTFVEEDYSRDAAERAVDAQLDTILRRYRVEIEDGD